MDEMLGKQKWGFLRETREMAKKAGKDKDTGLHRTGLEDYLTIIFPNTNDWIHDKATDIIVDGKRSLVRPDYRSESLKLIIEFDGLQHYTSPLNIEKDIRHTKLYENHGYKVVRIPYFIQLTNAVVESMFGVIVKEYLFNGDIPSMGVLGGNTPAFLCSAGVTRMAQEFKKYPDQYKVNVDFMQSQNEPFLTGVEYLESAYIALQDMAR